MGESVGFRKLLTEAVRQIKASTGRPIKSIQHDLGSALGRANGNSAFNHWRSGKVPSTIDELEALAYVLIRETKFGRVWLESFLRSARHPERDVACDRILAAAAEQTGRLNTAEPFLKSFLSSSPDRLDDYPGELAGDEQEQTPEVERLLRHVPTPSYNLLYGVQSHLDSLVSRLYRPSGAFITSIQGLGGIGKTSLANETVRKYARENTARLAGVVWVSVKQEYLLGSQIVGTASEYGLSVVFDKIAHALDMDGVIRLPLAHKISSLASRLRSEPFLVVIDNLETVEDFKTLVPHLAALTNPSQFILTSREEVPGLTGIHYEPLSELEKEPAVDLIEHIARIKDVPNVPVERVYDLVGGNPLAIILIVSQMRRYPPAKILGDVASGALDVLYSYIYRRSWSMLSDEAKGVLFSIQDTGDVSDWAFLEMTTEMTPAQLRRALDSLLSLSLVQQQWTASNEPAYAIHRLTSSFLRAEVLDWSE